MGGIPTPHDVYLLDTATGESVPGFEEPVRTEGFTGNVKFESIPGDVVPTFYVVGSGTEDSDTYDAVTVNAPHGSGSKYLRISTIGLVNAAATTGMFTPDETRAALSGTVYYTPGGAGNMRTGTVGCAQLFLDDSADPIDTDSAQRYTGSNDLPVPPSVLDQTLSGGSFYFGNLTTGDHTLRVSLDGGATFVLEQEFNIPLSREDSRGPAPYC